ncbi:hypothetical protein CL97_gp098 [Cronobacter phage CR9]|uniref:Uncharacterized protein n=1 Tax=Cronobacter phage CR9 TaxID=1162290 RepID=M1F199_9CAUD|nr:hypothetical protein CL97_gp098 [Cronobacter phage CR9]AFH20982.1 hypothetical protein CR9_098 [Cronobacter phage CR9]
MFVYLNQLRDDEVVCFDVDNIREFHPQEIEISEGNTKKGTAILLYHGDPWIVKQGVYTVYQMCQKAKRGEL